MNFGRHSFEEQYLPWLNLSPSYETSPFLTTVCCALASRHLDEGSRSVVSPLLDRLAESHVAKTVLDPQRSVAAVRALQILSLWAPVISDAASAAGTQDGRLTIEVAVRLALSMQLDHYADERDDRDEEMRRLRSQNRRLVRRCLSCPNIISFKHTPDISG